MKESEGTADDAELIRRARGGDQTAFRILVERYEPLVAGTVIGMLGYGPDADEVGRETFVRFWKALGSFRGDSSLGTYLTRIAMNSSLNRIRQRTRWTRRFVRDVPEEMPDPAATPAAAVEAAERITMVNRAVQSLPPDYRAVVVLRHVQGFSTRETAEALSIPVGTVLSRLSRAQDRLRSLLRHVQ